MNFSQMQSQTRRSLNNTTTEFYSDQDIKDALNEGLAELADATEYYELQATVYLLAGRTYYDLTTVVPDTFLSPRRCFDITNQKWLTPTDPFELDQQYRQWELVYGEPEKYFFRGNWWMGVWPRRATDGNGIRLYYTGIPPVMSLDTDTPDFPQEFHRGLIDYALSDLLSQQRETAKAVKFWQSYVVAQSGLKTYVEGRVKLARHDHI